VFINISDVIDSALEMLVPHDEILSARLGPNGTGEPPVYAEIDLKRPKPCQLTLTVHGMAKFARCGFRAQQARVDGFVEAFESLYPDVQGERLLYQVVKEG